VRASQVAATVGTVALGAAAAGTAAHVIALGQSAIVAAGAVALLPAALAGAVGTAIAAKVVFGGLGEAWKQTGAAAAAGGGATVDIAHKVQMAQRSVRDATQALADAQRDALSAQDALTRAREDEAERLSDLSRTVAGARLDERQAILAVEAAKRRMAQSRGTGDSLEIRQAQLAYEQSKLTLEEVKDRVGDLAKEQQRANEKGVEGSDAVQSARVVTSPSWRCSEMSFRRRRMILPDRVLGRSPVKTIDFGLAIGPIEAATWSRSSSMSPSSPDAVLRSVTKAAIA
jgi:hypothetical protein